MSLIKAEDIAVHFTGKTALHNISFTINAGEIVTVIGPNGAGKSSLVRVLVGALTPSRGDVVRKPNLRLGYVPQKLHMDHVMPLSVRRFLNLPKRYDAEITERIVDRLGVANLLDRQFSELSGGEVKHVLLAHALMDRPELLILDEPTAGLDQPAMVRFYGLIEQLRQELSMAILLVSHDLNIVMKSSDRVVCLNTHICCQGAPSDVSNMPEYTALLGVAPVAFYEHHHDHSHDHIGAGDDNEPA